MTPSIKNNINYIGDDENNQNQYSQSYEDLYKTNHPAF